jgi:hypothetical protein
LILWLEKRSTAITECSGDFWAASLDAAHFSPRVGKVGLECLSTTASENVLSFWELKSEPLRMRKMREKRERNKINPANPSRVYTKAVLAMMEALKHVPRCGAWSRHAQRPCRKPAMRGRTRCRLHGGRNPGAPRGNQNDSRQESTRLLPSLPDVSVLRLQGLQECR